MTAAERVAEVLDEMTPEGDFNPTEVAEKTHAHLLENEPDVLSEWEAELSRSHLREQLRRRLMRQRQASMRQKPYKQFHDASEAAADGELTVSPFSALHCIDKEGTRRPIGDMTGRDCRFVADDYQKRGQRQLFIAAFWRKVEKLAGKRNVRDVMDEQQFLELYRRTVGNDDTQGKPDTGGKRDAA